MAKVSFTKLSKTKNSEPIIVDFGEEHVQIQTYLPIEDKLSLISRIVEAAGDGEEGFYNIVKLKVFYTIEMLKTYTNINFTEKQLENSSKLYDLIVLNSLDTIIDSIPETETNYIWESTLAIAREVTNYNHSFLGVLKTLRMDYTDLNMDATIINEKLANPDNLAFLKDVLNKMG